MIQQLNAKVDEVFSSLSNCLDLYDKNQSELIKELEERMNNQIVNISATVQQSPSKKQEELEAIEARLADALEKMKTTLTEEHDKELKVLDDGLQTLK